MDQAGIRKVDIAILILPKNAADFGGGIRQTQWNLEGARSNVRNK